MQESDINNEYPEKTPSSRGSFLTERARTLANYLNSKIPGIGAIYEGIYVVLADENNPERVVHAAHSCRELIDQLRTRFPGVQTLPPQTLSSTKLAEFAAFVRSKPGNNELRREAEVISEWSEKSQTTAKERNANFLNAADQGAGPDVEHKVRAADQLRKFEKWLQGVAHHDIQVSVQEFEKCFHAFEYHHLEVLCKEYYEIEPSVILLAEKPAPLADDLLQLNGFLAKTALADLFFRSAKGTNWLCLLRLAGFFKKPVGIVEHEGGGISCPSWPQSQFLLRCAEQDPKTVAEILMEVGDTENARVHQELVEIAIKLPANLVTDFAKRASLWIRDKYHTITLLPFKLAELTLKLANEGELQMAFEVADSILDVRIDEEKLENQMEFFGRNVPPEAEAYVDDWHYGEMIKRCGPLGKADPNGFVRLMCNKLAKAIRIEHGVRGNANSDIDLTYIDRPAIEENEQNQRIDRLKDYLIDCIRDFTIARVRKGEPLKEYLQVLREYKYPVFRRIELHLLWEFSENNIDKISSWFSEKDNFRNPAIHHEFYLLLQKTFGMVTQDVQKIYLDWVSAGPDVEAHKAWINKETGVGPTDEQIRSYISNWKLRKYAPIELFLNAEHKGICETLTKSCQPNEHPEFEIFSTSWVGPTSPKDAEQLGGMGLGEVLQFLLEWVPPPGHYSPTPEGLGRVLQNDVRLRASEYTDIFDSIQPRVVRPVYLFYLFSGLENVVQDRKAMNWQKIIHLVGLIVFDDNLPEPDKPVDELETGWTGVRKEVARLFSEALRVEKLIAFDLRESIWQIIEKLSHEDEPTLEYETEYGGSNLNAVDLSVNTARGEAVHALFNYIFWVDQNINEGIDAKEQTHSLPPETMPVLTRLLDVTQEPTVTIRSVIGWYLQYLAGFDLAWTKGHLALIIPEQADQKALRTAAFEGYFSFNNPNGYLFRNLRVFFESAFDWANESNSDNHFHKPSQNYVDHLLAYYRWGEDPLDKKECLITRVFESGNIKLRSHAIESVGRSLETLLPVVRGGPEALQRLQVLLDWRLAQISQMGLPSAEIVDEMKGFGWWFANAQMDKIWLIDKLYQVLLLTNGKIEWGHKVIKRLGEFIAVDPLQVARSLDAILRGDPAPWDMDYWHDHLVALFTGLRNNGNQEAWNVCKGTINFLGERGFRSFGNLL